MNESTEELNNQVLETVKSEKFKALDPDSGFEGRVSLRVNNKEIFGTSTEKAPENYEELIKFLKESVVWDKTPDVKAKLK